jgi:signal peptidase I
MDATRAKIIRRISAAGVGAACVGAVLALGTWPPFATVMSASMEPTIGTGDVVVLRKLDRPPRVGDIIAVSVPSEARQRFGYPPTVIHRVVKVSPAGVITTKGDARAKPDPFTIRRSAVRARVVWSIPAAGQVVAFLTSTMGLLWLAAGAVLLVGLPLLERQRDAREAEQEALTGLRDELRGMSDELAALRDATLWQRAAEREAEREAPEPGPVDPLEPEPVTVECMELEPVALASAELEHCSAEPAAFNFDIDWSVLPDVDPFVKPNLLVSPDRFAEEQPTPAPPPAPVVVKRRCGGLVGAIGRLARSRRYG